MPSNYKVFHPRLGLEVVPHFRGVSKVTGEEVTYAFGALGERVTHLNEEAPNMNRECQMAIFGDSETIGFGLHYHETWPANLELLSGLERVCNFAVDGYGLDQYYLRYLEKRDFLSGHRLVVTYLPHFGHDRHMHAYLWGHPKPIFIEDENSDELQLILEHIKPSHSMRLSSIVAQWGWWSSLLLPVLRITEKIESQFHARRMLSNYSSHQMEQRAIKIIDLFQSSVKERGSVFILATSLPHLCGRLKLDHCIFFERSSTDQHITKLGDNTLHLKPESQLRLADTIFTYLTQENLLQYK